MISSLTVEKLACMRGERRLFDGLSFIVRAGQALAVEGPNGSGKTSLLRMVAGFLPLAAGAIRLARGGADIVDGEERGKCIGWLGHQDALKAPLTVTEQLRFFTRLYARPLRLASLGTSPALAGEESLASVLEQVGLARQGELPCRYLSAGQKRRLALARLMVSGRPLWLMDEPLAALDPAGKALVARLMAQHCGAGGMVLAATHEALGFSGPSLKL